MIDKQFFRYQISGMVFIFWLALLVVASQSSNINDMIKILQNNNNIYTVGSGGLIASIFWGYYSSDFGFY